MTDELNKGDTGDKGDKGDKGDDSLSIEQLDYYIKRLEARYRLLARWLTAALVVVSVVLLGTLAWTADGLRDRVADGRAERRASILEICEAINMQNRARIRFLRATAPENVELAMDTFPFTPCGATVRDQRPSR